MSVYASTAGGIVGSLRVNHGSEGEGSVGSAYCARPTRDLHGSESTPTVQEHTFRVRERRTVYGAVVEEAISRDTKRVLKKRGDGAAGENVTRARYVRILVGTRRRCEFAMNAPQLVVYAILPTLSSAPL